MRKASLGTLFFTVFLDLLGFGLVVPFLPGVARNLGASDLVATLVAASFSAMQFLFIPLWGRLSDRVGRRPVLLWSVAASAIGMTLLGFAHTLPLLFIARLFSGIATANIAVAQAYIADITTPQTRARGMGIIGMGFGLGFIVGPAVGGFLGHYEVLGQQGTLAAFTAAGLSVINFVMALRTLPESLPPEKRGKVTGDRRRILDLSAIRRVSQEPGMGVTLLTSFFVVFWFSGLEVTFRLFTEDAFGMSIAATGGVFAFVGVIGVIVQGGLIHRLSRRFGEVKIIRTGLLLLAVGFAADALAADIGAWFLYVASLFVASGSGLYNPSLNSYSSQKATPETQGLTLGVVQSLSALARVLGPPIGGLCYQYVGIRGPYLVGAAGLVGVFILSFRLAPLPRRADTASQAAVGAGGTPLAPTAEDPIAAP
jgi:DHA1 family tetracycline resistance protein-like MFS transporter